MYICVYMYVCIYIYIYTYVYVHTVHQCVIFVVGRLSSRNKPNYKRHMVDPALSMSHSMPTHSPPAPSVVAYVSGVHKGGCSKGGFSN